MKRDSASGDGISLCTIDSSGYTAMDAAAVMKIQAKLAA
jgi:20S proteasome alpha/beta subunit